MVKSGSALPSHPRPAELRSLFSRRAQLSHGQPISELMSQALANPHLISLAAGFVDQQSLPCEETQTALAGLLADRDAARRALQYGTTPGYLPLREQILHRCLQADGADPSGSRPTADQVVLTAGSNQLLHLIAETLLDPGDIVLCSAPSYFVFLGALQNLAATACGIACDDQGILPEALEEQLTRFERVGELPRVKALYLVSYYDNPRGVSLSCDRRQQVVDICRRWSDRQPLYIIDDLAYRELRYDGGDLPSLRHYDPLGQQTIVAGTFSKSFSPGIRVGWGLLPAELVEPICNQKGNIDFGSPNFSQHLMDQVLRRGLFDSHVQRLRAAYRIKRDAMLEAAGRWLAPLAGVRWVRPDGGLYVWVELPATIDTGPDGPLFHRAIEQGVLYVPGQYCFPVAGASGGRNTLRLSFGVQSPERIADGMNALGCAISEVLAHD